MRSVIAVLFVSVCFACGTGSSRSHVARDQLGPEDIREIFELTVAEVLHMPSSFGGQEAALIQVEGYSGRLPEFVCGKRTEPVPDYLAASERDAPSTTAFLLAFTAESSEVLVAKVACSWGTGQSIATIRLGRDGQRWHVVEVVSRALVL